MSASGKHSPRSFVTVISPLRHVAGTQWGYKKYMNMKHLEATLDDVSTAGSFYSAGTTSSASKPLKPNPVFSAAALEK